MTIIAPSMPQEPPAEPPPRPRRRSRAAEKDGAGLTVGVVFVHGIGSQRPGETLLDWSRPLVRVLTEWANRPRPGARSGGLRATSTSRARPGRRSSSTSRPRRREQPADEPAAAQRWILTEAWWASRVQPPSLATMTGWLRDDFGRVVRGGPQGLRRPLARGRLPAARACCGLTDQHARLAAAGIDDRRWGWIDRLDRLQARSLSLGLGVAWVVGALLLVPYAALRALPIQGLRDAVGLRRARRVPRRLVRRHADPAPRSGPGGQHPGPARRLDRRSR